MNLRQIDFFLAVAEAGSLTAGAERMGVSQQAMSTSIRKIEEDLGVRLFERRRDGVTLTDIGNLLREHAQGARAEMVRFRQELAARMGVFSGRLNIGVGPSIMGASLVAAITALRRHSPKLMINVYAETYRTMLPRLLRGELDLFIGILTENNVDPMVDTDIIKEATYQILTRPDHPLARRGGSCTAAELTSADWILGLGLDVAWQRFVAQTGVNEQEILTRCIQTTSLSFLLKTLPAADYLAFLPGDLCAVALASGDLVAIDMPGAPIVQPLAICSRRNSTRSPITMKAIGLIKDAAAPIGS